MSYLTNSGKWSQWLTCMMLRNLPLWPLSNEEVNLYGNEIYNVGNIWRQRRAGSACECCIDVHGTQIRAWIRLLQVTDPLVRFEKRELDPAWDSKQSQLSFEQNLTCLDLTRSEKCWWHYCILKSQESRQSLHHANQYLNRTFKELRVAKYSFKRETN